MCINSDWFYVVAIVEEKVNGADMGGAVHMKKIFFSKAVTR